MNTQTAVLPSPDTIRQFPLFQSICAEKIYVIHHNAQCQSIATALSQAPVLGFDTESKPTFVKGEVSTGPHLIQLATFDAAYLFQVNPETLSFLQPILANPDQIKVGFGLKNDVHLFRKKGIELSGIIDLAKSFGVFGIKTQMGVKNAVALLFQQHFIKNKKVSTSNWAKKNLTQEQIQYAAADAYAPVIIFKRFFELELFNPPLMKALSKAHASHPFF